MCGHSVHTAFTWRHCRNCISPGSGDACIFVLFLFIHITYWHMCWFRIEQVVFRWHGRIRTRGVSGPYSSVNCFTAHKPTKLSGIKLKLELGIPQLRWESIQSILRRCWNWVLHCSGDIHTFFKIRFLLSIDLIISGNTIRVVSIS